VIRDEDAGETISGFLLRQYREGDKVFLAVHHAYSVPGRDTMSGISLQAVGIFFVALLILFVLGWLLALPGKTLLRFFIHALCGGLLLLLARTIAPVTGILPSVNPATLSMSILLGVPGALLAVGATAFLQGKR
jgi:inhibitor of the pro-sigma K processing machinery